MVRSRLDLLLVERGLAESREKAKAMIMAGLVTVDHQRPTKPGVLFRNDISIDVKQTSQYVGRGGVKLAAALDAFDIDPSGAVALDVGASTGGFTDCLLQRGAAKVYAVDVGYGQLAHKLRIDPRVAVKERVNARYGIPIPEKADIATADVSFISLRKVLMPIAEVLKRPAVAVVLFKPQFEVGKGQVGKGGVVRDPLLHARVLGEFLLWAVEQGFRVLGVIPSPILGDAGNREFLVYLKVE
ncbi:MAG: TlyA family RNA methyltransferase [Dehalococcoidia bacterium]|nr:TlyA family RNA methyltransferase [Dehalococcoidia bacterium]